MKNEILPFVTMWMTLEEMSAKWNMSDTRGQIPLLQELKMINSSKRVREWGFPRLGIGYREILDKEYKVFVTEDETLEFTAYCL